MTALTFTIDVSDTQVEELKDVLDKLDIRFDPERQLVAFNESFMDTAVAMGHHTPDLIRGVNHQLNSDGLTPLVPDNHTQWTLARRIAFLKFAVREFAWQESMVQYCFWLADGKTWEEVVGENPLVFTGQD